MNNLNTFHGLLLVDKPSGITSHDVVARLRRVLKTKAVGHTGTLDPLASGLMVCLVNEGTKLSNYILEGDKGYILDSRWGIKTDTLDITGTVIEEKDVSLDPDKVERAARSLVGDFNWEVPVYSAIKVNGQKLYEYARRGEGVEIPLKEMSFWDLEVLELLPKSARFAFKCSKGSYVRTWIEKLGSQLECPSTMSSLRRFYSAPYQVEQAISLEKIETESPEQWSRALIPLEQALVGVKVLRIKGHDEVLFKNGQISHDLRSQLIVAFQPEKDQWIQVHSLGTGKLLGIVGIDPGRGFAIKRGFNY